MKKKLLMTGFVIAGIATLTGCAGLWEDMQGKSINASTSGIGGVFTTSVDVNSGTATPSVKMGDLSAGSMSHKPGDGSMVYFDKEKSFWGSEIGSEVFKYNGKSGIKSLIIVSIPKGQTTITVTEYEDAVATAVTALSFKNTLKAYLEKNDAAVNAKIYENLAKLRGAPLDDAQLQARREQLTKMSDAELSQCKPGIDTVDNRMVGDELLWRSVNEKSVKK